MKNQKLYDELNVDELPIELHSRVLSVGLAVIVERIALFILFICITALVLWFGKFTIFLTVFQVLFTIALSRTRKTIQRTTEQKINKYLEQKEIDETL